MALSKELTVGMNEFVDAPHSIKYVPNCGHWVQLEEPALVNKHILEFLKNLTTKP